MQPRGAAFHTESGSPWISRYLVTISTEAQRQPENDAETGQALVEYALILTLVTLFCLVSLQLVSTNLRSLLDSISSAVAGAV